MARKKVGDGKVYRVIEPLMKKVQEKQMDYIVKNREKLAEAELVNALVYKGLKNLKDSEIQEYLEIRKDL